MSSIALYQKYRSQTFDELVGQKYVVQAIRNAVKENRVGHAYLFCGPRGTGKTSMARLLARAVNCADPDHAPCNECENCRAAIEGTHPDIIEINAANETHVEDIRDLIERARLSPMMGKHKIYIIDEVHQLSSSAASALLKTLEEPPEHVIFILATTDPQKLLKTIISRCQRFDFSKVDTPEIQTHLLMIAGQEGFTLEPEAARKIAELADGGMRDSLSILEQARAYGNGIISEQVIDSIFGLASLSEQIELLNGIFARDLESVLTRIRSCESHGTDLRRLTEDLISDLKDGIIYQYTKNAAYLHMLKEEQAIKLSEHPVSELLSMIDVLMKAQERYRTARSVTSIFEIACLELMNPDAQLSAAEIRKQPGQNTVSVPSSKPAAPSEKTWSTPAVSAVRKEASPGEPATKQSEPLRTVSDAGKTEPLKTPSQPAAEPAIRAAAEKDRSPLAVLGLLVQCSKSDKAAAEPLLAGLLAGPVMNRYNAGLRQMKLRAAGKDILLFTGSEAAVHMFEEPEFELGIYTYLKESGIDKAVAAVTEEEYRAAVDEFRSRSRSGTLPEPSVIQRPQAAEKTEQKYDTEQAVLDLFGKENVEIIDGGE